MTSISTSASFGSPATATVDRAGATTPSGARYFPYTSFIAAKSPILFRNTVVFTTMHMQSGLRQHRLHVLEHPHRLLRNTAGNQLPGRRIKRNLPRSKQHVPNPHSLGVRPNSGRGLFSRNRNLVQITHTRKSISFFPQ